NDISLQALGLLTNIMSYPETWELRKTELYKRYKKNKETSVSNAWKELVEHGFIIECKIRDGKKWDYNYYIRLVPFTEEEKEQIRNDVQSQIDDGTSIFWTLENQVPKKSDVSTLDFQDPKMRTSKSRDNKKGTKEKQTKEINTSTYVGMYAPSSDDVFSLFGEYFELTKYAKKQLKALLEDYSPILVYESIERAVDKKPGSLFKYMGGILANWKAAGAKTKEDIERIEKEYREKQKETRQPKKQPKPKPPAEQPQTNGVEVPQQMSEEQLKIGRASCREREKKT